MQQRQSAHRIIAESLHPSKSTNTLLLFEKYAQKNKTMRNISILLSLLLAYSSCDIATKSNPCAEVDCSDKVDLRKWRKEVLVHDSILINGKIPLIARRKEILALLGEPDQKIVLNYRDVVLPYLVRDTTSEVWRWIYGRTIFDEVEGMLILNTLYFESTNIELVHPKLVLKQGMDLEPLCKLFPESCKLSMFVGNALAGHVELKSSFDEGDPSRWFLIFRGGRLLKVVLCTFSRN